MLTDHDGAQDATAIAKAHAIYTPLTLSLYDRFVHGFSNRFAWDCPTERLLGLYRDNLSARHLEAGVGTGYFIDHVDPPHFERLVLLDINRHCLARSSQRLARFRPVLRQTNLLAPLSPDIGPVDSIGLTYVLHCLPGRMADKLEVIDHLGDLMGERTVLFGATILGAGIKPNAMARRLLGFYNSIGAFNNREDDFATFANGLHARFTDVELERLGCVVMFRAA